MSKAVEKEIHSLDVFRPSAGDYYFKDGHLKNMLSQLELFKEDLWKTGCHGDVGYECLGIKKDSENKRVAFFYSYFRHQIKAFIDSLGLSQTTGLEDSLDVRILRLKEGCAVKPHVDKVEDGQKMWSYNMVISSPFFGGHLCFFGPFGVRRANFGAGDAIVYCASHTSHSISEVANGTLYLLSIQFLEEKEKNV